jgi:hypothetical protein
MFIPTEILLDTHKPYTQQGTGQDEEPYNTTSEVKWGSWLVHEQGRVTETGIHRVITDKRRNYYFYVGLMSVSLL